MIISVLACFLITQARSQSITSSPFTFNERDVESPVAPATPVADFSDSDAEVVGPVPKLALTVKPRGPHRFSAPPIIASPLQAEGVSSVGSNSGSSSGSGSSGHLTGTGDVATASASSAFTAVHSSDSVGLRPKPSFCQVLPSLSLPGTAGDRENLDDPCSDAER